MRSLLELARHAWVGTLCALLPMPERGRLVFQHEVDAPRWSFGLGLVQAVVGGVLFLVLGLGFMRPAASDQSMWLLSNWFPGLSTTHFSGVGLINWFAWFLTPLSWPLSYLAVVGGTRCVAFAATREAVAEPVVWLALRAGQRARRAVARRRFDRRLGPLRPDRVESHPDEDRSELLVISCREKSDWGPATTIAIGDRYYRLAGVDQRVEGDFLSLVYRLREEHPGAIIRRLVAYEPPRPWSPS